MWRSFGRAVGAAQYFAGTCMLASANRSAAGLQARDAQPVYRRYTGGIQADYRRFTGGNGWAIGSHWGEGVSCTLALTTRRPAPPSNLPETQMRAQAVTRTGFVSPKINLEAGGGAEGVSRAVRRAFPPPATPGRTPTIAWRSARRYRALLQPPRESCRRSTAA